MSTETIFLSIELYGFNVIYVEVRLLSRENTPKSESYNVNYVEVIISRATYGQKNESYNANYVEVIVSPATYVYKNDILSTELYDYHPKKNMSTKMIFCLQNCTLTAKKHNNTIRR